MFGWITGERKFDQSEKLSVTNCPILESRVRHLTDLKPGLDPTPRLIELPSPACYRSTGLGHFSAPEISR